MEWCQNPISSRDTGQQAVLEFAAATEAHLLLATFPQPRLQAAIPGLTTSLWGLWWTRLSRPGWYRLSSAPCGHGQHLQRAMGNPLRGVWQDRLRPEKVLHVRGRINPERSARPHLHRNSERDGKGRAGRSGEGCDRWELSAPRLTAPASEVTDASEGVGVLCAHPAATHRRRASVPATTLCGPPLWLLKG